MNIKRLSVALACALSLAGTGLPARARAVRSWNDDQLINDSDVIAVGKAITVRDLNEKTNKVEHFMGDFRGVETTFRVSGVYKGNLPNDRLVLHHYGLAGDWALPNAPDFVSFTPGATNEYLLYLVKDGPTRFAATSGQLDPAFSVKPASAVGFRFGFPVVPPIADADPSVRHPLSIQIPTELRVQRTEDSVTITFASFETTNLTVGAHMATGFNCETTIYRKGDPAAWRGNGFEGGLDSVARLDTYNYVFTRSRDGIPQHGEEYVVEYRLTIFETDLPSQHMWSPQSGKCYKALWTQNLKQEIK